DNATTVSQQSEVKFELSSENPASTYLNIPSYYLGANAFDRSHVLLLSTLDSYSSRFAISPLPNNSQDTEGVKFTILRLESDRIDFRILRNWLTYCKFHYAKACHILPGYPPELSCLKVIECQTGAIIKAPEGCEFAALSYKDEAELAEQVGIMDIVYSLATVTLIAACGEDAHFGLPGVGSTPRGPQPLIKLHGRVWVSSDPESLLVARIKRSRWWTRAWTYQEGLFSRRRIFFTETEVYFECNDMCTQETVSFDLHDSNNEAHMKFTAERRLPQLVLVRMGWVIAQFDTWAADSTSDIKIWLQRTDGTFNRISDSVITEIDKAAGQLPYTQVLRIESRTIQVTFRYLPENGFQRPYQHRDWAYPKPVYFVVTLSNSDYHYHHGTWYWP
ncbi:hypothetical protein FCOIX_2932, partial [Fusarium coicis]